MSLTIKNTGDLIHPDRFRLKILLIAPPGFGKTDFLRTVPNIGVAACEEGDGRGLATIARYKIPFVEPETYQELDAICGGLVFRDQTAQALDSLTAMQRTFIKAAALAIPRKEGSSQKRAKGIPELDDYGTMAEMTRQLLQKLVNLPKHIIVTAGKRTLLPDPETGRGEFAIGPDLPGQMFLGAPAMFDIVLVGTVERKVKDIGGKRVQVEERYWVTQPDGINTAKCRLQKPSGGPVLEPREPYNINTGEGTFPYIYQKVVAAYTEIARQNQEAADAMLIREEERT